MASITISGKVSKPPELRFFDSGTQLCKLSVVDREYVRPEKKGEDSPGQFYDCEIWGKTAEIAGDRLSKGSKVTMTGQAVWREWLSKQGEKRRALSIKVSGITYLDTKDESQALKAAAGGTAATAPVGSNDIPF